MRSGAAYPDAYLGHMASETVVSHNVMTSGMLPKHMGWSDEWYRDTEGLLGAGRTAATSPARCPPRSSTRSIDGPAATRSSPTTCTRPSPARPSPRSARRTTPCTRWAGPGADMRITFGGRTADCDDGAEQLRRPDLARVRRASACRRTSRARRVRTLLRRRRPRTRLRHARRPRRPGCTRVEGNRDVPGVRPRATYGGDVWVDGRRVRGDGQRELERTAADLRRHRQGRPHVGRPQRRAAVRRRRPARRTWPSWPGSPTSQVGRVVQKLKDDGLLDETLIVLTTDHAQQTSKHFYGARRGRARQLQLVLRLRRGRDLPDPAAGDPAAGRRDRQRAR